MSLFQSELYLIVLKTVDLKKEEDFMGIKFAHYIFLTKSFRTHCDHILPMTNLILEADPCISQ